MRHRILLALLASLPILSGCEPDPQSAAAASMEAPRATPITIAVAELRQVELTEVAVGRIEARSSPGLTAEVDGRALRVLVDTGDNIRKDQLLAQVDPAPYRLARDGAAADAARFTALLENGERQLQRQQTMLAESFVTQSAVDQAEAELRALREQLRAAQSRLAFAERELAKTEVRSPMDGIIDQRLVTAGDFVQTGRPLFQLVSLRGVTVHLPFPEALAGRLAPGLPVRLSTPLNDRSLTVPIQELRPALNQGSRAIEVILPIPDSEGWRPGGSVRGQVVLDSRQGLMVPEVAVVDRPAGRTVYAVVDGKAVARAVRTGVVMDGWIEVVEGLQPGTRVAVDGAGFLTDGAAVAVPEQSR